MGKGNVSSAEMSRTFKHTIGIALVYLVASAHVGSPDTWFEGKAGPYNVTVQIVPAGVVPGVAKVYVRSGDKDVSAVGIQANKFDVTAASPPPEIAERSKDDPSLYSGKLWMMSGGSNSITVSVNGGRGAGKVVVPVVVVAYSRLALSRPMGLGLSLMGLFLFAGIVSIIGAAVREAPLAPGEAPTPRTRKRARNAMALTSVITIALLVGGWRWWNSEDANYKSNMDRPFKSKAEVANGKVNVVIAESTWVHRSDSAWLRAHGGQAWTPLIEDHGKLMHVFLIRDDMSAFAHLHPSTSDSVSFPADIPPLPAGRYRVFADIVHESGFTHTLVSSIDLPANAGNRTATGSDDDSWYVGGASQQTASLSDGRTIRWTGSAATIPAGKPASLHFEIRNADGTAASLEPFLGMPGHAVVEDSDGSVFVHLHPMGTISMASQMAFAMREPGDTIRGKLGKRLEAAEQTMIQQSGPSVGTVSFPYAFPKPGRYRVWVQVRIAGKIETASFSANVV